MFFTHLGPIWYIGLDSDRRWHAPRIQFFEISSIFEVFGLWVRSFFLGEIVPFFRTLRLGLISAKPYYQNARIDRGITLGFP